MLDCKKVPVVPQIEEGTPEVNLLLFNPKVFRLARDPISLGILPLRLLNCRANAVSDPRLPIVVGSVEVN